MAYRREYNGEFGALGAEVAKQWPEKAVIAKKGKRVDTLGLALSGGGYRSAIFNYGILKGLYDAGLINKFDYLSVVSGGSWIGTAFALSNELRWFFDDIADHPNLIEEGFESFLANPLRVGQELRLARMNLNYVSNLYGRLLARTFLRESGQASRHKELHDRSMITDADRPFLIINGTVNFRRPRSFDVTQECFEMTRLYCGSRSLGYVSSKDLAASEKPIRVRDAIAISGAALAFHLPGLGSEVAGMGLSREIVNYTNGQSKAPDNAPEADHLDLADGGFYNNLGVESLVNRGCGYIVVVDAEYDPESKDDPDSTENPRSGQKYSGLRTLLKRNHIKTAFGDDVEAVIEKLDAANEPLHVFTGRGKFPDILYIKLKSCDAYDEAAKDQPYNKPGFFDHIFNSGDFSFSPQFSTAKLDYDFAEHRNLSELGAFIIKKNKKKIGAFVNKSK